MKNKICMYNNNLIFFKSNRKYCTKRKLKNLYEGRSTLFGIANIFRKF